MNNFGNHLPRGMVNRGSLGISALVIVSDPVKSLRKCMKDGVSLVICVSLGKDAGHHKKHRHVVLKFQAKNSSQQGLHAEELPE